MDTATTIHVSNSDARSAPLSKGRLWTGRIMSGLPALFLLIDAVGKLLRPAPVVETTVQLGYPESGLLGLGIVLLTCTILYLIPRTAVLGAKANEAAFFAAVDEVAWISSRLLSSLQSTVAPKNRQEEAAKARALAAQRFGK